MRRSTAPHSSLHEHIILPVITSNMKKYRSAHATAFPPVTSLHVPSSQPSHEHQISTQTKQGTHARTQSGSSSRDRAGIPTFQTATLTSAHKGRRRRVIRLNFNSARNHPPAALAWPCIAHVCMCKYVPQSACTYHRVSDPCPRRFRPARARCTVYFTVHTVLLAAARPAGRRSLAVMTCAFGGSWQAALHCICGLQAKFGPRGRVVMYSCHVRGTRGRVLPFFWLCRRDL